MKDILKAYDGLKCRKVCIKTKNHKTKCKSAILRLIGDGTVLCIDSLFGTAVHVNIDEIINITISYNPND